MPKTTPTAVEPVPAAPRLSNVEQALAALDKCTTVFTVVHLSNRTPRTSERGHFRVVGISKTDARAILSEFLDDPDNENILWDVMGGGGVFVLGN